MDYANLIAAIHGIIAAIGVWQAERDYKRTQETYRDTVATTLQLPDINQRAAALAEVMPPEIAATFRDNLTKCWETFNGCVKGATGDDVIVPCEETNQRCICGNLRAIARNSGSLPPDLFPLWMQFACGPKPQATISSSFQSFAPTSTFSSGSSAAKTFQRSNS